jgi:hypothetical protein
MSSLATRALRLAGPLASGIEFGARQRPCNWQPECTSLMYCRDGNLVKTRILIAAAGGRLSAAGGDPWQSAGRPGARSDRMPVDRRRPGL